MRSYDTYDDSSVCVELLRTGGASDIVREMIQQVLSEKVSVVLKNTTTMDH